LNEKNKQEILRTPQVVQATLACMEIVLREKRYRHFMELWEKVDPQIEPEKNKSYYDNAIAEKRRIQELDKQRQFSIAELF
jgi:DNA primase